MRKMPRIARFFLVILTCILILSGNLISSWRPASGAAPASGQIFEVNSPLDTPAPDPSTGVCADVNGKCTLRAAIMVANFVKGSDMIILPPGVYTLTRPGYDDGALVGDLDISDDLTIEGAGSGATIVDGNGAVTGDRVFQILSSAQDVTLKGMTIRGGISMSSTVGTIGGGGIFMEGSGHLLLSDVILEDNTAQNGGGLEANFTTMGGSIGMDHVIVRSNTANAGGVGAGGGVFAYLPASVSQVDVTDSQVYSNTADGTGGGFFIQGSYLAHWQIKTSDIYANNAASGGAIGNFIPLSLADSTLHNNHVSYDGGAIEALAPLAITRTTLSGNSAGRFGGGIFDLADSSIALFTDFDNINQSTLSGNFAHFGGGIYHDGYINHNSRLTLTNSTVSGNVVSHGGGGGLYVYSGSAQLFNSTIASNRVFLTFPVTVPEVGGGIYITATSVLTAENSIFANNTHGLIISVGVPDDCYSVGTTGVLSFNMFTTFNNCFVTGGQVGNITVSDPGLGPLMNNGGFTLTHALLAGSPAIDAGATLGCTGAGGVPLTTDQRGYIRPYGLNCDIGAFEYNPNTGLIYLPILFR